MTVNLEGLEEVNDAGRLLALKANGDLAERSVESIVTDAAQTLQEVTEQGSVTNIPITVQDTETDGKTEYLYNGTRHSADGLTITEVKEAPIADITITDPAKPTDDTRAYLSDVISAKMLSFLQRKDIENSLSYRYVVRNSDYLRIAYVYGDKAVLYKLRATVDTVYCWIERIYLTDIDSEGFADEATAVSLGSNVQEFALRYRKSGTTDAPKWFPYHGAASSTFVTLISDDFWIDGVHYNSYTDIPLDTPVLFDKIVMNQKIASKYDVADLSNQVEADVATVFDATQLHFSNEYTVLENIDVNRFYGSRLSCHNGTKVTFNNGVEIVNDLSNVLMPSGNKITSAIINHADAFAVNQIDALATNISQDKTFFNNNNVVTVFNYLNGTQVLYWNLAPALEDGLFTNISANQSFKSGNNLMYVPKSYGLGVNISIPLSGGLKAKFPATARIIKEVTTTTYNLVASDKDKILHFTDVSGCAVTVPAGLTAGNRYEGKQLGGQVTFVAGTNVALNCIAAKTLATQAQYAVFGIDWLENDGTDDVYLVYGELELI